MFLIMQSLNENKSLPASFRQIQIFRYKLGNKFWFCYSLLLS